MKQDNLIAYAAWLKEFHGAGDSNFEFIFNELQSLKAMLHTYMIKMKAERNKFYNTVTIPLLNELGIDRYNQNNLN